MKKVVLTDKAVGALKPASKGKRYIAHDVVVPGFGVRVTSTGHRTFVVGARIAGSKHFVRREVGEVGTIALAAARDKARAWLADIKMGLDPSLKQKQAAADEFENIFKQVAEDFIRLNLTGKRKAHIVTREIRRELIPVWGNRKIAEITRRDVVKLVEDVAARGVSGSHARNIFGHIRNLFNWAINRGYGELEHSPCDRLKPAKLIGAKKSRQRVLNDDELRAVWRAASRTPGPYGNIIRALLLTGCRRNEVTGARRRELDLGRARLWVIPAKRYKTGSAHLVPLTANLLALLEVLPRFNRSDLMFSVDGKRPFNHFSRAKKIMEPRVLRTWRALGRAHGVDRRHAEMDQWTLHDLRRTVRTRLAALKVPEVVAELIIGHTRKGVAGTYDRWNYIPEMREALVAWHALLRSIVNPPTAPSSKKVVSLRQRRRA